eukprot:3388637-Rhodomonas_salina.1
MGGGNEDRIQGGDQEGEVRWGWRAERGGGGCNFSSVDAGKKRQRRRGAEGRRAAGRSWQGRGSRVEGRGWRRVED